MTVPVGQVPVSQYVANGVTTVFPYAFKLVEQGDLVVELNAVPQTGGFVVSGIGNESGGAVTFSSAPVAGTVVNLFRDIALGRENDYQTAGDFRADVVNPDFDRIWQALQGHGSEIDRSFKLPIGSQSPILPPVLDPQKYWRNRADGLGVDFVDSPTSGDRISLAEGQVSTEGQQYFDLSTITYSPGTNSLAVFVDGLRITDFEETSSARVKITQYLPAGRQILFEAGKLRPSGVVSDASQVTYTAPGDFGTNVAAELSRLSSIVINVKDPQFAGGATGDGVTDDTAAFNSVWQYVKASIDNDTANLFSVSRSIVIPPGTYLVNGSINWTDIQAWNIHVDAYGAKLLTGSVSGKAVLDCTNVRGLHIRGLMIESNGPTMPLCGILVGPRLTDTCGNNSFTDVKIAGKFSLAAYINIGSETTSHYNCYFINTNTSSACYAAVFDGANSFSEVVSNYTTLRATGVAVSFTNNRFYSCHIRKYTGGSCAYLRCTVDWAFDSGCYWLSFDGANVVAYQGAAQRNVNLSLEGLFESTQGGAVDYVIRFIVPDGDATGIVGFRLRTNTPHAGTAVITVDNESGGVTTGSINLSQSYIDISGRTGSCTLFHTGRTGTLVFTGDLRYRASAGLNLFDIQKMLGSVYTTDGSLISGTPSTVLFAFVLFDETTNGGQFLRMRGAGSAYLAINSGATVPELRGEGTAADVDVKLTAKGAGRIRFGSLTAAADAPITGYIEIKDSSGTTRKLAVIS